ncbi:MAG: alpha/beta hydrolase [Oscillospiraceae bacterium]|jgi:pimeloyl-ACP methyl ester carboxylesterase|nr:alpha/beta hydrolase [Oscillospiraceae bacterium]
MQYVFIHGLGQDSLSWENTISRITSPISVVCSNLSEFLDNKEMTYMNLYHSFSEYCNRTSEPLNLCGLSLGGVLALNYTIDYPAKVHSLVLIGTQYKMPKTLLRFQNIIFRFMPESIFKNTGFKKNDFIQLTNSMSDLDFSGKLSNITCPVLVMCGDKDNANKKAAKNLAANILQADIQFIEKAGHEVNVNNPKSLAEKLDKFYSAV